jgi:hypothetical protein
VLSGRGFCAGLITRPEKSYRVWCVPSVCSRNPGRGGRGPKSGRSFTKIKDVTIRSPRAKFGKKCFGILKGYVMCFLIKELMYSRVRWKNNKKDTLKPVHTDLNSPWSCTPKDTLIAGLSSIMRAQMPLVH